METTDSPREPIALIGRSLRFPGANSPSELLELLRRPKDLCQDFPPNRLNIDKYYHPNGERHGSTNVRQSYFISSDHRVFDAAFFNISPVEAEAVDPQQRILLELVFEALESAGLRMEDIAGSRTSVFVGLMSADYADIQLGDYDTIPRYAVTGTANSIMSNRISHFFNLRGPSMTIDTACSSSLVAIHQAVQSLRIGESDLAVVAGANLILSATPYIAESSVRMLSPTSRCRMWDAKCDGYSRGDGFAVVILKTLKNAVGDANNVLSVIRETAVNTDGHTPGLTVPSAAAQASLIRETYARAGLDCTQSGQRAQYFEAHGTGTQAGDPVEANAIQMAFFPNDSRDEPNDCLLVGSIKTVVGHLEGCAGLAGLLKASLAVENGLIFPNLHFNSINPTVSPFTRHLRIPQGTCEWPEVAPGSPRRASVNSFGFGGTNAHALVESYASKIHTALVNGTPLGVTSAASAGPFVFSAHSQWSLVALLKSMVNYLRIHPRTDLRSLASILQTKRSALAVRVVFSVTTRVGLLNALEDYIQNGEGSSSPTPRPSRLPSGYKPRILGVFTGQGAQGPQMGRKLLLACRPFGVTIDRLQDSLDALSDRPCWSLRRELLAEEQQSRVYDATIAQPLCTAIQLALASLLHKSGIHFAAVVGHSSGEIAAACVAGFLSPEDAIRIAYYRGLHISDRSGAMLAVDMAYEDSLAFCKEPGFAGRLAVAASNSPSNCTLSGDVDKIEEAEVLLRGKQWTKRLRVNKAYHSHHMEDGAKAYVQALENCKIKILPTGGEHCAWVSSVSGDVITPYNTQIADKYWADNLMKPVLFDHAVTHATHLGRAFDLMVEIGPHPSLRMPVTQTVEKASGAVVPYMGTLHRKCHDVESFSTALGHIWSELGAQAGIAFGQYTSSFFGSESTVSTSQIPDLPPYPWDHRQIYWTESRTSHNARLRGDRINPLLGLRRPDDFSCEMRWRTTLNLDEHPWLRGHAFQGQVLFPAAGYISMALEAAKVLAQDRIEASEITVEIQDTTISRAMILTEDKAGTEVNFTLRTLEEHSNAVVADFICASCPCKSGTEPQINATGKIHIIPVLPSIASPSSGGAGEKHMLKLDVDHFYNSLEGIGLQYTSIFRAMKSVERTTRYAVAFASWRAADLDKSILLHPAVLDVSFQAIFASVASVLPLNMPYLPTHIQSVTVHTLLEGTPIPGENVGIDINAYTTDISPPTRNASAKIRADLEIIRDEGETVYVEGLTAVPISDSSSSSDRCLFSKTIWNPDISGGIDQSHPDGVDPLGESQLPELIERLVYAYLRDVYASTPPERIASLPWYQQRFFEWMKITILEINNSRHPIIKKEWADIDTIELLLAKLAKYPENIDLTVVTAVHQNLPDVLAGERTMLEVLMANDMLTRLYDEGLVLSRGHHHIARMAKQICHRYPQAHILEIGAGTGSTTSRILETVKGAFASYVYTDISSGFFTKARERFQEHLARMDFRVLNIEGDPNTQGFTESGFDVVVASSVLHATPCLNLTLQNLRKILKPGGYLLLLEPTSRCLRVAWSMGGLPGWWLGGDDGRRLSPCLEPRDWNTLLCRTGFSGVDLCVQDSEDPTKHVFSAILSQAVDDRITLLRQPLLSISRTPVVPQLVIVGGRTTEVAATAKQVLHLLRSWKSSYLHVSTAEKLLTAELAQDAVVLCLAELDTSVFDSIDETTLAGVQRMFSTASVVLYVTRGCQKGNPASNMAFGVARTLHNEFPNVRIQMLDIDNELDITCHAKILAETFLRLALASPEEVDFLWSREPEIMLDKTGRLHIPRVVPDQEPNQRLMSKWNPVRRLFPAKDHSFEIRNNCGAFSLRPNNSPQCRDSRVVLQARKSLLHPVQVACGTHMFLCIGTASHPERRVLGLSVTNASSLAVDAALVYTLPSSINSVNEAAALHFMARFLLSRAILGGLEPASVILLHEPDPDLAAEVIRTAKQFHIQVRCTTTRRTLASDRSNWVRMHANITTRQAKALLPAEITRMINFEPNHEERLWTRIRNCLSASGKVMGLESLFPAHPQSLDTINFQKALLSQMMTAVTSSADQLAISISKECPKIAAGDLTDSHKWYQRLCVVDWTDQEVYSADVQPIAAEVMFRSDRTYFLAGLTGDVGQSLLSWMVQYGARHFVMASRSGANAVPTLWIEEMETLGAQVRVFPLDITDQIALHAVHDKVSLTMPPIGGVVHGAMVLDDTSFGEMTVEKMTTVCAPKVAGAKNLDALFRGSDLDFFVMLSSVSAVVGFYGQANYGAANMFLKGLAEHRRRRGLVASVLAIGTLSEIGYVARTGPALEQSLHQRYGCLSISEPELHQMFAEAIVAGRPYSEHAVEIITGMPRLRVSGTSQQRPWLHNPRFSHLVEHHTAVETAVSATSTASFRVRVADCRNLHETIGVVAEAFTGALARMLQLSPDTIDNKISLMKLGIDSLIAMEIRSWFQKELDVDMPVLKVLGGHSIAEIVEEVAAILFERRETSDAQAPLLVVHGEETLNVNISKILQATSNGPDAGSESHDGNEERLENVSPMSFAQSRLWFLISLSNSPAQHNIVVAHDIKGPLSVKGFEKAFQAVVKRHPGLRTSFFLDPVHGEPMQRVLPFNKSIVPLVVKLVDVDSSSAISEEIRQAQNHIFDLSLRPAVRATLICQNETLSTFIFSYSHMALDGASMNVILQDLNAAYGHHDFEPPSQDLIALAVRQRRCIADGQLENDIKFWREELTPLPPTLPLLGISSSRARSDGSSYSTHSVQIEVPRKLAFQLREISAEEGATPFHLHLTVLQWVLFKFLPGTDDICIGIADANRLSQESLRTVGLLLNLLPLRARRYKTDTFVQALSRTSGQVIAALQHSTVPFEVMLQELQVERSAAYTPLFQVFVNYRMGAVGCSPLGECQMQHRWISEAIMPYDLLLSITEPSAGSCFVSCTGRDDIYSTEACGLFLEAYMYMLGQVSDTPNGKLEDVALFSEAKARDGLDVGRNLHALRQRLKSLPSQVDFLAQTIPNRLAVKDGYGNKLTYSNVAVQNHLIARLLSEAGVGEGSYVAMLMHPCSTVVPIMLAILRLGAIYVPLDPSHPPARLQSMITDCRPTALVCQQNTIRLANAIGTPTTTAMDLTFLPTQEHAEVENHVNVYLPAFALYTSGSTGTPKGVLLTQSNVLCSVEGTLAMHSTRAAEVVLQQSSLGFDLSLYQMARAIISGGMVVVVPHVWRQNPKRIAQTIRDEGVTLTVATPSEYSLWLQYGGNFLTEGKAWNLAVSSGESINSAVVQGFQRLARSNFAVDDWFGPTETGVWTRNSIQYCDGERRNAYTNIGKPFPGVSVYILDDELRPVPVGFPGEMCIEGLTVSQGYVGDDDLTKQKFVHVDLGHSPERVYRSGDKGRLNADGSITFLGRIEGDSQVKLRGFRIDLEDIKNNIRRAAGEILADVAVLFRGEPGFLIAFAVFNPGSAIDNPEAFLNDLRSNLPVPKHMRPSRILPVARLPLTVNGKLDRAALEKIPLPKVTDRENATPLGSTEERLRELWAETLPSVQSISQLGRETDFFDVGGSSIQLFRLGSAIADAFSINAPLAALMRVSTLGAMAGLIDSKKQRRCPADSGLVGPVPHPDSDFQQPNGTATDSAINLLRHSMPFKDVRSRNEIDWDAETVFCKYKLAEKYFAGRPPRTTDITIVLTGATETLGNSILAHLVCNSKVRKIHCLGVSPGASFLSGSKIEVHRGHLLSPFLGLSNAEWKQLVRDADLIINASVEGSYLSPYHVLRERSLGVVKQLGHMAVQRRVPIHYVSSARVVLFSGATCLGEMSVESFPPPVDGSEGLAAARWACEKYLQNLASSESVPVRIHRCCAYTCDHATDSEVLSSIWKYSRKLNAVPVLDNIDGFIDWLPLENLADALTRDLLPAAESEPTQLVRFIHHPSGKKVPVRNLATWFQEEAAGVIEELSMVEWVRRAREQGLSPSAADFLNAAARFDTPMFFPLLLKTTDTDVPCKPEHKHCES